MDYRSKVFATLLAFAVFFSFAGSSLFDDESTNVSVNLKPEDCEVKPPITTTLTITVKCRYKNGTPVDFALGQYFISNQKIDDSANCTSFYRTSKRDDFATDAQGNYTFTTLPYMHDNKGDLWRMEIYMKPSAERGRGPQRDMQVVFYSTSNYVFNFTYANPL